MTKADISTNTKKDKNRHIFKRFGYKLFLLFSYIIYIYIFWRTEDWGLRTDYRRLKTEARGLKIEDWEGRLDSDSSDEIWARQLNNPKSVNIGPLKVLGLIFDFWIQNLTCYHLEDSDVLLKCYGQSGSQWKIFRRLWLHTRVFG